MDVSSIDLQLWHIAVICLVMLLVFFILNYLIVMNAVNSKKMREDRIERTIAAVVNRDMNPETRHEKKPRRRF